MSALIKLTDEELSEATGGTRQECRRREKCEGHEEREKREEPCLVKILVPA